MRVSPPPTSERSLEARIRAAVREIPDFPAAGIQFKDITPVLADPLLMRDVIAAMSSPFVAADITHVVAMESRGFIFGMPVALTLQAAFAPARKPGKLPWRTEREAYVLEYRRDVLEMHADAIPSGARVLVVDDVLATGGTAAATCRLIERLGGTVQGIALLGELGFLEGRALLPGRVVHSLVRF